MRVSNTDLYMTRGDTESITISCPARPFDTGDVVEMTVREMPGFGNVLIHKKVTVFTDDGKAVIYIDPHDTSNLAFLEYSYDVQVTFTDIGVKTIVKPSKFVIETENTYDG